MRQFLLLVLVGWFGLSNAQAWKPRDSVRHHMLKRPDWAVGLDGRQSFVSGHPVTIAGARYGLDYGKVGFYTGMYGTNLQLFQDKDSIYYRYQYMSCTFEYYLYETWRWQLVTSFQAGYGGGLIGGARKIEKLADGSTITTKKVIIPLEAGISGTVRFLRYFGFYVGIGFRLSPINSGGFSGPYYGAGLTYFTGTMWRDTKKLYRKITGKS